MAAITVYLARNGKLYWVTLFPAMFMTCVCTTYIFFAPEGLGLDYMLSLGIGIAAALLCAVTFAKSAYAIKGRITEY